MKVLCIKLENGKEVRSMVADKILYPTEECIKGYMPEEIESTWLEWGMTKKRISPKVYLGSFFTKELLEKAKKKGIPISDECLEEIEEDLKFTETSFYFLTTTGKVFKRDGSADCIRTELKILE